MKLKAFIFTFIFSAMAVAQESVNAIQTKEESKIEIKKQSNGEVLRDDPDFYTKSSFGMIFYTLGGVDDTQFKGKDPSFSIYDAYVGLSWKISSDVRLSLLPTFGYTTAGNDFKGRDVTDKFSWRDSSIAISQNRVLEQYLPASFDLKQKARLYLPTSDGSKEEGMIARLRLEVEGRYNLDRFSSVRYYAKPSYYFQRTTAFLTSDNKTYTTKKADIQHGPELNWSLSQFFSIKPGFEIEDNWSNESEVNFREASHKSKISNRLGVEVRPHRDMNFTLGIQESRNLVDPSETPIVSYSLLTNVTLF
jgi:hypothetical protein